MLVPAIVYRPRQQHGRIPGIVVVNGHGGDKFSWYAFYSGMMFARAGAMSISWRSSMAHSDVPSWHDYEPCT